MTRSTLLDAEIEGLSTYGSERRGYMVPPGMLQIRKHTGDSELSVRKEEVSEVMVV